MSYIGNPIVSTDFPKDTFSGNGSTTAFTMSIAPASVNAVIVVVSGITQDPSTYTISGTTLTFSGAPPTGTSNISVRHLGIAGIPNTPSAGSVVTASIADSNVTQAKLGTNVAGNGPAFSAYSTATQSFSSGTFTKVQFNNETFDTNSNFDSSTNYRFTPTVAGYYQINAIMSIDAGMTYAQITIYKNGSLYKRMYSRQDQGYSANISDVVYLNGSTDYVEIYVNPATTYTGGPDATKSVFSGALIRAA